MSFQIELVGGPKDGERMAIEEDRPALVLLGQPPMPADLFQPGSQVPVVVPVEISYLRTGRVTGQGYRIYAYSELKRA